MWTVDAQVEGTHFRRDLCSWEDVGWRSFMAAASDVAAMGGAPWCALSSLVLAPEVDDADLDALARGQRAAADAAGAPIVGGNLSRGATSSVTTTVLGTSHRAITRSGARAPARRRRYRRGLSAGAGQGFFDGLLDSRARLRADQLLAVDPDRGQRVTAGSFEDGAIGLDALVDLRISDARAVRIEGKADGLGELFAAFACELFDGRGEERVGHRLAFAQALSAAGRARRVERVRVHA